jgi:Family of unknown function (DUF6499)
VTITEEWGVPDWRAGEAYPEHTNAPTGSWAWEFLRRNWDYRRAWQHEVLPFYDATTGLLDARAAATVKRLEDRFGISPPCDPRQTERQPLWRLPGMRHYLGPAPKEPGKPVPIKLDMAEVAIVFDLTFPIDEQLERARFVLEQRQSEQNRKPGAQRPHSDLFASYLRILDAKDARASNAAIADVLFPKTINGPQTVANRYRAAKQIRDKDFRLLAGKHPRLFLDESDLQTN